MLALLLALAGGLGRMRLLAAIQPPDVTQVILDCFELPSRAPPTAPAAPIPRNGLSDLEDRLHGSAPIRLATRRIAVDTLPKMVRRTLGQLGLLVAGLAAAVPAGAVPMAFQGTLSLVFSEGALGEITAQASGVTDVDTDSLRFALPAALFQLSGALDGPAAGPVERVEVEAANAAGWPDGEPRAPCTPLVCVAGGLGSMPLPGTLRLHLRDGPGVISLPMSLLGRVPSPPGGVLDVTVGSASGVTARLAGREWVPWTWTAWAATTAPFPDTVHRDDDRTPGGAGLLQLVTPIRISIDGDFRSGLSGYARLDLRFVPEPGALGLVATGLLGLASLAVCAR